MNFFYLTSLLLTLSCSLMGQYHEVGLGLGIATYYGDLSPKETIKTSRFRASAGAYYTFNMSPHIAARLSFNYASLEATDQHYTNPDHIKARNLSFRTTLAETAIMAQFNLLPLVVSEQELPFTIFIQGGIAGFYFNPKTQYRGDWYELQPLGTEGQGIVPESALYSRYSLGFPVGIGAKFTLTPKVLFGLELTMVPTLTDYLDDVSTVYADPVSLEQSYGEMSRVLANRTMDINGNIINQTGSQRGNDKKNDWYGLASLIFSYRFIDAEEASSSPYLFDRWL